MLKEKFSLRKTRRANSQKICVYFTGFSAYKKSKNLTEKVTPSRYELHKLILFTYKLGD